MESNPGLLPADILLEIFSYCSYTDLVKFQSVCKWWQQVTRHKHLWKDIVYKPDWTDDAKQIIENLKASPELQALDLRYVKRSTVTKELVQEIANGCPGLEQLTVLWDCLSEKIHVEIKKIKILILDFEDYDEVSLKFLQKYFPNVEHIDCSSLLIMESDLKAYLKKKRRSLHTAGFRCETYDSHCILPFLSVCTNLKSLTLFCLCDQIKLLNVQSMEHLKRISSLTLRDSKWSDMNDYLSLFAYFPNLVVLQLDKCTLHDEQPLRLVAENCPLIEKLTLSSLGRYFRNRNLTYISNFKKLKFLCLRSNSYINDDCVVHLQAILELRYLDISDCEEVSPQCLLVLCSFDKLQTLKFDLQYCDLPANLGASHVKNPDLHIMFYNCKDTCVLDHLRRQRLRISLLKEYSVWD
ncbi:F-box/LRR-repeat protein fbxl-1 [Anabrus simplex]|uniref:F-box/LRR-repeat protein fbxl-1 n=1 Tax=Anabrus simplex TaxID=316456 RepID=UPI0035A2D001